MKVTKSHIYERALFTETVPSMRYDGSIPFGEWQAAARAKLCELLGLPLERCAHELTVDYEREHEEYREYRFSVQTEPGYYVPCHLLVPNEASGKVQLTLCLMGHSMGMHIGLGVAKTERDERTLAEWPDRALALCAVKQGRAALVLEARNFGEASVEGYGVTCTEAAKTALLIGRTVIGERVWDAMRVLDAVSERFDFLDLTELICTGNSGGGTATYYLSCLDERIKISAPSCAVCEFESSIAAVPHCMCNNVPRIKKYFEMGDLGGMIAPRQLIIAAGKFDPDFPISGTKASFARIRALYSAAGAEDNCRLLVGENAHYYYADLIWNRINEIMKLAQCP